ncbi:MAG TPA: PEP-CTERM sorting domain-containing protein [Gammaproteobacteria bacterium]|nr:PEP-CTERM sorting domain-containing protein [Gammaproteobacteria bacterium]
MQASNAFRPRRSLRLNVPLCAAVIASFGSAAHADVIPLNFATVNQSLWGPGNAVVYDGSLSLPDPYLQTHVSVPGFGVDATGALLDFLGVGNIGPSLTVHPEADVTAGVTAGYHINSGAISLNYPEQVVLDVPDSVQAGQPFTVDLRYPGTFDDVSFLRSAVSQSGVPSVLAAAAGGGYAAGPLTPFLTSGPLIEDLVTPQAGFTTTSPYAEAYVRATLLASANIHAEACIGLGPFGEVCPVDGDISLGTTKVLDDSDILKLSTLTGLSVLGQDVLDLSAAHLDIPGGFGSVDFASPSIALDDDALNADGALDDSAATTFLSLGIDVDQLVPLVGTILHNSVGPFSYDLLSVEPTLSLTLHQSVLFDPTGLDVDLHFSDPVICEDCADTQPTRDVRFAAGESRSLLAAGGDLLGGGDLTVTPTFSLEGTLHNRTYVTLDGSLDITALELTNPTHAGPVCCDPVDLFEAVLPGLDFDEAFPLFVPSITAAEQVLDRTGFEQLASIQPAGVDAGGHQQYRLAFENGGGGGFTALAEGTLVRTPVGGAPTDGGNCGFDCVNPCDNPVLIVPCDTYFEAAEDVFFGNSDLGRLFCIECIDAGRPDRSPSLVDTDGVAVFFSDLTDYPSLPSAADIVDPASPYYDPVLANSARLFGPENPVTIAGGTFVNHPHGVAAVPEPGGLALLGSGLFGLVVVRRGRFNASSRARRYWRRF